MISNNFKTVDASLVFGKDSKPSITNSTNQVLLDGVFLTASLSVVLFLHSDRKCPP